MLDYQSIKRNFIELIISSSKMYCCHFLTLALLCGAEVWFSGQSRISKRVVTHTCLIAFKRWQSKIGHLPFLPGLKNVHYLFRVSNSGRGKKFSLLQNVQTGSETHLHPYPTGTGDSSPAVKRQATCLHLDSKLRTSGKLLPPVHKFTGGGQGTYVLVLPRK